MLFDKAERLSATLNATDLDAAIAMIGPSADIRTPMGTFAGVRADRKWIAAPFLASPDMRHESGAIAVEAGRTLAVERTIVARGEAMRPPLMGRIVPHEPVSAEDISPLAG